MQAWISRVPSTPIYATGNGVVIESKFDKDMAVTWLSTTDSVIKRCMPTWIKILAKKAKKSNEGTLSDI